MHPICLVLMISKLLPPHLQRHAAGNHEESNNMSRYVMVMEISVLRRAFATNKGTHQAISRRLPKGDGQRKASASS